ncbi:MAG: hypothetical protein ACTTG8_03855 [Catonella sp.]|uniref:hypothetical protein n=1 Tax=Catonella sp. TaxID=2382125 RepID=UPI003FA17A58
MKRKVSFVCLVALLLSFALPTLSSANNADGLKQIARGDKKVHHPINVHSTTKYSIKIM